MSTSEDEFIGATKKRVPRASSRLKVNIDEVEYIASEWNHIGCKLQGYHLAIEKGSKFQIELVFYGLNSESRVKCQAEVMWSRNDELGLRFESLPIYEENLVTHQLREALKLVGKKRVDFADSKQPTDELELENIKTVKHVDAITSSFTHAFSRMADFKGAILFVSILVGLILAAFYTSSDQVGGRGTVVSDVEVVQATEDGTLLRLFVGEGDHVKRGSTLFETRDEVYYREELARLGQLRRDLDEASKSYLIIPNASNPGSAQFRSLKVEEKLQLGIVQMYQDLYSKGAVAQESVLEKLKDLAKVQGQLRLAQSKQQLVAPYSQLYQSARQRLLNNSSIEPSLTDNPLTESSGISVYKRYKSPSDGIILKLPRLDGSALVKGATLAVIQPTASFPSVRVFLPHDASDRLRIGNKATIRILGIDGEFTGFVSGIDKRGGLKMKLHDNQVGELFDHSSSLQETPAEVLIHINRSSSKSFPVLSIGAKATVSIDAAPTSLGSLSRRLISFLPAFR